MHEEHGWISNTARPWKRFYYKTEKCFGSGFVDKSKIKGEQNYMRIF